MAKKAQIFAGKLTKPDSEDPDTVNHLNWYEATSFKRPYPGEKKVRPPSEFNEPAPTGRRRRLKHVPTATALSPDRGEGFFVCRACRFVVPAGDGILVNLHVLFHPPFSI